jgi:hypothetical protein
MEIFYSAVGDKLPALKQRALPQSGWEKGWFWVVHGGSDTPAFFTEDERALDCIRKGGAILFISAARYGGLGSESAAEAMERPHNGRVYCLRSGCTATSVSVQEHIDRFLSFVTTLLPGDPIPWHDAEPAPTHENLLALYLLLKAIEVSDDVRKASLISAWTKMPDEWKATLINSAIRDHQEVNRLATPGLVIDQELREEDRKKSLEQITRY